MDSLELERTYLAKELPKEIDGADYVEIVDIYIPEGDGLASLRLRKKADKYFMTKKTVVSDDASEQVEQTIKLSLREYEALSSCSKKRVEKRRYYAKIDGHDAEVDVFYGDLAGLVLVEFEFANAREKDEFVMPESMLADVTPEEFIAGGMLAGKKYEEIEGELERFGYKRINVDGIK
ncbi:hypothetical protein IKX73_02545 [Candidatus Saccharibacteria bacterium]|nr:hypothetical protein [Candidatus Saccharibacteria bacterium]